MAAQDPKNLVKFKINDKFAQFFDELVNIRLTNRKSDVGFTDEDSMMVAMRPGTTRIGNAITGGSGNGTAYSYTDKTGTRRLYRTYGSKLWYLNGSTWTNIKNLTTDKVNFSVYRIPTNISGLSSTTYTSPTDSSGAEKIKVDAGDTSAATNIGKVLIVTSGIYKGAFATILNYNSGTTEYELSGSGMITSVRAGSTYSVYDTVSDCLQVCTGISKDIWFDGVTEQSWFEGFTTDSLRQVRAIGASEFVFKTISWQNLSWTWKNSTLFFSSGINNPFFFEYVNAKSLGRGGSIVDFFTYKNRLICLGDTFVVIVNSDYTFDWVSNTFGGKANSAIQFSKDIYFLTTSNELVSLVETIDNKIIINDIVKSVKNYVKDFNVSICTGVDGDKIYIYGQKDSQSVGTIIVLDFKYKFWSTYTGLSPAAFLFESGITYLFDNNSDIVRKLDLESFVDVGDIKIEQKIVTKEQSMGDPFNQKTFEYAYIWLENIEQKLKVQCYVTLVNKNGEKQTKNITIAPISTGVESGIIGESLIGDIILGGDSALSDTSVPRMKRLQYDMSSALTAKYYITGVEGSPFYLNELWILPAFVGDQKFGYFSPSDTI